MSKIWRTGSLDPRAASIEERTEPSPQFREQAQENGGLAGLSSSGQHDHRARLRGALQAGFNSASNPHIQIYDIIAYVALSIVQSQRKFLTSMRLDSENS